MPYLEYFKNQGRVPSELLPRFSVSSQEANEISKKTMTKYEYHDYWYVMGVIKNRAEHGYMDAYIERHATGVPMLDNTIAILQSLGFSHTRTPKYDKVSWKDSDIINNIPEGIETNIQQPTQDDVANQTGNSNGNLGNNDNIVNGNQ